MDNGDGHFSWPSSDSRLPVIAFRNVLFLGDMGRLVRAGPCHRNHSLLTIL